MAMKSGQAAYQEAVEARLTVTQAKVNLLRRKVVKALKRKEIEAGVPLRCAMERVEHHLSLAELHIGQLGQAGADEFDRHRLLVDDAIENLAESIRKAVLLFL